MKVKEFKVKEEVYDLRCDRCHKRISVMTVFYQIQSCSVGPECLGAVKLFLTDHPALNGSELITKIRGLYLEKHKSDTIRGMQAKGLL